LFLSDEQFNLENLQLDDSKAEKSFGNVKLLSTDSAALDTMKAK
jgi:hypothetical protein